jgi:hypothetical protein
VDSIGLVIEKKIGRRFGAFAALVFGTVLVTVLAGCGSGGPSTPGAPGTGAPTAPKNCTQKVSDAASLTRAVNAASPGDTICVDGNLASTRLQITKGGEDGRPISIVGNKTPIKGLLVRADNVVVDGFVAERAVAPGAELRGNNITLSNTLITDPQGGDNDGIRFWGDGIKILHNTVVKTANTDGSHADCMQTFATDEDHPASQDVLIDGNRCEDIDNNCLIAEGPDSSAGDGSGEGESKNITFSNNYCDSQASQAVMIDDVSDMVITGNEVASRINHAFAFQNNATGARIADNRITGRVKYEVGMDEDSEENYQGPEVGGDP